jgi:hypothetical protein
VGTSQVIKIKLHIDGIPIQNADRTFVYEDGWKYGNIPHISQLHKRDSVSSFPEIPPKARRSVCPYSFLPNLFFRIYLKEMPQCYIKKLFY